MLKINRLQYKDLLDFWVDDNDIKKEDVCIVSSSSLAVRGLRKNNDIDFTINPHIKEEVPLGLDNTETTGSFGQSVGHPLKNYPGNSCSEEIEYIYNKYNPIGLTDNQLFSNPEYYDILDGYKIVRPEISASYRQIRSKSSDSTDIRSIGRYIRQTNDWDWNLLKITEMESEKAPPETKIDNSDHSENWAKLFRKGLESLAIHGVTPTARSTAKYLLSDEQVQLLRQLKLKTESISWRLSDEELVELGLVDIGELMWKQYDEDEFISYELAAIEAASNEEISRDTNINPSIKAGELNDRLDKIVITDSHGKILNPQTFLELYNGGLKYIPVAEYTGDLKKQAYDYSWLQNQSFSPEELDSIQSVKNKLLDRSGGLHYFIIWGTMEPWFEEITDDVSEIGNIIEIINLDLDDELASFVEKLYQPDHENPFGIEWKKHNVISHESRTRMLKVALSAPTPRSSRYEQIEEIKHNLRMKYREKMDQGYYYSLLHISDSGKENRLNRDIVSESKDNDSAFNYSKH